MKVLISGVKVTISDDNISVVRPKYYIHIFK